MIQLVVGVQTFPSAFSVLSGGVGRVDEKGRCLLRSIFLDYYDTVALNECDLFTKTLDIPDAPGQGLGIPARFDSLTVFALLEHGENAHYCVTNNCWLSVISARSSRRNSSRAIWRMRCK